MKNAFIVILLGIALVSLFSFHNNRVVIQQDDDEYTQNDSILPDTISLEKDSIKKKQKVMPYDFFGKSKHTDTLKLHK